MELRPVVTRLSALSHRLLFRILLTGTPLLVLWGAGLAALTFLLDWSLKLPVGVRAVLLLLSVALLGWGVFRKLLRPLTRKPRIDDLALMVEKADPSIKDQIISALQLERDLAAGRAVESPEMIRALVADTVRRYGDRSFAPAVSLAPARKPLFLAAAAVIALAVAATARPDLAGLWLKRQILLRDVPWPQANTLAVTILDMEKFDPRHDPETNTWILHVPERTPLQVTVAAAEGKTLPDEVSLVTATLDDPEAQQAISMGRAHGKEWFQHIFPPLLRSLVFHAEGGDDDDGVPVYEIRVARAPRVQRFWADFDYPDYTGLADRSLSDANLSAPEGTRIAMHFEVNMDLAEFSLEFDALGKQAPVRRADGAYTCAFTLQANDFYTYHLKGDNGVASTDVPRYVVTCEADQPPRISMEMPSSTTILVTPEATLPLKGTATDDYGIAEVGLRFGPGGSGAGALDAGVIVFQGEDLLQTEGPRQTGFFHALRLSSLTLPSRAEAPGEPAKPARPPGEGDRFAFRITAADNRRTATQPEPHRVFGDYEFQVQVLSPRDLQRELAQKQVRLRDRVKDIANLVEARLADTTSLVESVRAEADQEQLRGRFWQVEQDQNRISIELQASARQFQRVFDGYLWNRVDPGFLTEKLIDVLTLIHRKSAAGDAFQVYGEAIGQVRSEVDEGQLMGRLTVILDLLLRTSAERSPEAYRRLARAGLVTTRDERLGHLQAALEMQKLLCDDILLLVDRLEAWEDYLDVIQGFRDLLDAQKSIEKQIEKITK